MADIDVTYKGSVIRSMSASGQEVLHTAGKLCEDDITIDYTQPGGGGANLQTKSVSYTPDETGISDTILPDPGYDGLDEVDVTVAAIPDTYVGSAVPQRDSTSLTSTGQVVHVPAGYYASAASRGVANGTAGTPSASKGAVSNHSVDVTPSVTNTTGWITGSTITGTPVTVSASELVSGSQTVTVNDTYDVTNLAEMVVNVSGGGSIKITSGTSYNMTMSGVFEGFTTLEIISGGSGSARYVGSATMYGAVFKALTDITYSGFLSVVSGTAVTDMFRAVRNIKSIDYGGIPLPASLTRMWYTAENCSASGWIPHITYIKGLIWDAVTTMTTCFQSSTTYATSIANGQYIDIDFTGSEISGNLNFAPNATNYYPFTDATLQSLIDALKNGVSGTIKIGQENLNRLSAAQIAQATAKGWTISA